MAKQKVRTRKLFHYTSVTGALGILMAGKINTGKTPFRPNKKTVVCLTADLNPDGHGLTEGEVIRKGDPIFEHVAALAGAADTDVFVAFADQKAVRLTVEVECGPALQDWEGVVRDFYRRSELPKIRKVEQVCFFELSVHYPLGMNHISVEELASSLTELRLHPYKSKASTWWFYQGALPSKAIVKVEHRKVGEDYVQVTGDAREFLRPYVEEELLRMGQ